MKLVPAKCGCEGCLYEYEDECPADDKVVGLNACTKDDKSMIFVDEEDEENESRV